MSALVQTPAQLLGGRHRLYAPPPGYSDFPFTWIFDAVQQQLVATQTYQNLFVDIQSGYGDFILRQVLGLDTVLTSGTGQFQFRDMHGRYLQSLPQYVGILSPGTLAGSGNLAIIPERLYKELSQIVFDLYDVSHGVSPGAVGFQSQLGFQGVRRLPSIPRRSYRYRAKPYTYVTYAALLGAASNSPVLTTTSVQPVNNYDFDLYQIFLFFANLLMFTAEGTSSIFFEPTLLSAAAPQGITVEITSSVGDNLPLTVTVSGSAITVQAATNGVGQVISTAAQVAAAINANAAASQLVYAIAYTPVGVSPVTPTGVGPTALVGPTLSVNTSWAQGLLFDQNSVQVYSQSALDLFINAASYYRNGSIVPPLHYAQNSRIRMDLTPLVWGGLETFSQPLWATIHYVGEQRIPC